MRPCRKCLENRWVYSYSVEEVGQKKITTVTARCELCANEESWQKSKPVRTESPNLDPIVTWEMRNGKKYLDGVEHGIYRKKNGTVATRPIGSYDGWERIDEGREFLRPISLL